MYHKKLIKIRFAYLILCLMGLCLVGIAVGDTNDNGVCYFDWK